MSAHSASRENREIWAGRRRMPPACTPALRSLLTCATAACEMGQARPAYALPKSSFEWRAMRSASAGAPVFKKLQSF